MTFNLKAIWQRAAKLSLCIMSLKIILLKLLPHLQWANELTTSMHITKEIINLLSMEQFTVNWTPREKIVHFAFVTSYFDHNEHDILMQPYVGETHGTTSYFFCYDSLKSASSAEICEGSVKSGRVPLFMPCPDEGEWFFYAFSYQIQMQFRCNWRGSFRDIDDWKVFYWL